MVILSEVIRCTSRGLKAGTFVSVCTEQFLQVCTGLKKEEMERIGRLNKETRLRETLRNYTFSNKFHGKK